MAKPLLGAEEVALSDKQRRDGVAETMQADTERPASLLSSVNQWARASAVIRLRWSRSRENSQGPNGPPVGSWSSQRRS
jgi:hypothetical protein